MPNSKTEQANRLDGIAKSLADRIESALRATGIGHQEFDSWDEYIMERVGFYISYKHSAYFGKLIFDNAAVGVQRVERLFPDGHM